MSAAMDRGRIIALAGLLDALQREQEAEGFAVFCIGSDDRVSHEEGKTIVAAVKAFSNEQSNKS